MAVKSLIPADTKFPTKEYCQRVCDAEPDCQYYFYGQHEQSCDLYPEPQKSCTAIIGTLEIEKCNILSHLMSVQNIYYDCLGIEVNSF